MSTIKTTYVAPSITVYSFLTEQGFAASPIQDVLIFRDDSHPMEQYNTHNSDGSTNFFRWE